MAKEIQDAHTALKTARERFQTALNTTDPTAKDGHIRAAFCSMYRAADIASMLYTTLRRKGVTEDSQFLSWISSEFSIFVDVINTQFYIKGCYPKDQIEPTFEKWFARVRDFVNKLDGQTKLEQSAKRADEWMIRKPQVRHGVPGDRPNNSQLIPSRRGGR